jgi:acyl-CoA oxidase
MFLPTLRNQMSDEQQEKWLPMAMMCAINGTYAQTELGHGEACSRRHSQSVVIGTNLRALETTATYDRASKQFIIDTPTITATKWWPGNLGTTSNYAIVMAQLITPDGVNHGPHAFLVQLRDRITHMPCPGVEVGDIGPKFGFAANDNGYLRLHNVRIPREQMLMRNAKVLPNGEYVPPSHSKLNFGTMIFVRSVMIADQAIMLSKAATIAVRYSCVRRQGQIDPRCVCARTLCAFMQCAAAKAKCKCLTTSRNSIAYCRRWQRRSRIS